MSGQGYGFLLAGKVEPQDLARVLDEVFAAGTGAVEVAPQWDADAWRWDTPVQCGYEWFSHGDIAGALHVYAGPAVPDPPSGETIARALARELGTAVLVDWRTHPWVEQVLTPGGGATFARVDDLEGDAEGCEVTATHAWVEEFPNAVVEGLPEVVRHAPLAPQGTAPRLWLWTDLICRMEAGWPPVRWYGIDMYRENLESRDELRDLEGDPELGAQLEALDARFRAVTVEDAGLEIGADPAATPWYWHRRPAVLPWRVLLPADPEAADRLWEWVLAGASGGEDLMGLDLSGAVLDGADFTESWAYDAKFAGARLVGACFYRSHLKGADLSGADATGACFVRADLDESVLRGTVLDGADLVRAELYGADLRGASLRGARILGAVLLETDLRGADLSGAVLQENSFGVTVDDSTVVAGLTGTVFGPAEHVAPDGSRTTLAGGELEDWIAARGGDVRVLTPRRP
ncbi:pentapeptide repeat-containing protein [Streptomyces sp. NBC_00091]|uniref:pentapeptide repeat-containing protein n=1 Tax=Streptomyces sp. NBC_00091 TaxID=2975648 RepID=UPI002252D9AD|nr:pentapeptide repeat-containing protein [Streptomyces sp. NBC_00091]MCX5376732.1 pentapeptide repeat-containing protein [Streptomyces sp. NBC_00091]